MQTSIAHVALWVRDLEAMKDFYQRHFGAESSARYHNPTKQFSSYFLRLGSGARLELMHKPGLGEDGPETFGYAHLALCVGDEAAVIRETEKLRAAGVRIQGEPRRTGDGFFESVVLDPEGNPIELCASQP